MGLKQRLQIIMNMLLVIAAVLMMGCANYQFGNLSKAYCTATTLEAKAFAKSALQAQGVELHVNYCTAYKVVKIARGEL